MELKNNYVDTTKKSPTILSLCTGMRGIERGLERVFGHITIAAYVEIESFVIWNLVRQMENNVVDAAPIWTDLKTFPSQGFRGLVDIIIGGYPCQPFSLAGNRNGTEDPRHLFPHIAKIIDAVRPVCCFFENVDDHLSLGFEEVRRSLSNMGYRVEAGVYTAKEVGAPHERARLFILAVANTDSDGYRAESRILKSESCSTEGETQGENRKRLWSVVRDSHPELADTNGLRWKGSVSGAESREVNSERWQERTQGNGIGRADIHGREFSENERGSEELANTDGQRRQLSPVRKLATITEFRGIDSERSPDRWPAPQGLFQYEWEAQRAVEPGLGCTVNGYNFRIDLLRMLGNGVVEEVAELAFIDLLKKHKIF